MHDPVIRNGRDIDGSGSAARAAGIAIDGETILTDGSRIGAGRHHIEADGRLVAVGFTETHTPLHRPSDLGPRAHAIRFARHIARLANALASER